MADLWYISVSFVYGNAVAECNFLPMLQSNTITPPHKHTFY